MSKTLCPYCFSVLKRSPVAFRCVNFDKSRCADVDDAKLAAYKKDSSPTPAGRVFETRSPLFGRAQKAVCECGMTTIARVCPECHNELPGQYDMGKGFTLALIGAKETGKSHYITVLIHELQNRIGEAFGASLGVADEHTKTRYDRDFKRHIYDHGVVIPTTRSTRENIEGRHPLIFQFKLETKIGFIKRRASFSLVFFDASGEDLKSIKTMSTETRYIANSDAIIVLVDPLQFPAVRDRVHSDISLPLEEADPIDVVTRAVDLIRRFRGYGPNTKIPTPIAIVFSKVDAVREIMDSRSPMKRASKHHGYLDIDDVEAVDENIRAHLADWIGTSFERYVAHNFATYSLFGVSSLGSPPDGQGNLRSVIAPFRVEDPFLWLLYKLRRIKGARGGV